MTEQLKNGNDWTRKMGAEVQEQKQEITSGFSTQMKMRENDGSNSITSVEVLGQGQIMHIY